MRLPAGARSGRPARNIHGIAGLLLALGLLAAGPVTGGEAPEAGAEAVPPGQPDALLWYRDAR